jgi:hypothetical protein
LPPATKEKGRRRVISPWRILQSAFLILPTAFSGLMAALVREYATLGHELDQEPDGELLALVLARLREVSGRDQPETAHEHQSE